MKKYLILFYVLSIIVSTYSQTPPNDLMQRAKKGDVKAMINLGDWYIDSKSENCLDIGTKWYANAANKYKSAEAAMKLYYLYEEYYEDEDNALAWLEQAALFGDGKAQFMMSENSDDCKRSKFWLELAAKNNNPEAAYEYGLNLLCGPTIDSNTGITFSECYTKSENEGMEYIRMAANLGYSKAKALCGIIYWCGTDYIVPVKSLAYASLEDFISTGDNFWIGMRPLALCILGLGSYYGINTDINYEKAFKLLSEGSDYDKYARLNYIFLRGMLNGVILNLNSATL